MNFLSFKKTSKGAALVEYGILVGLIAVLAIVAVLNLGSTVRDTFNEVSDALSTSLASASAGVVSASGASTPAGPANFGTIVYLSGSGSNGVGFSGPELSSVYGSIVSSTFPDPIIRIGDHNAGNFFFYSDGSTDMSGKTLACDNGFTPLDFDDANRFTGATEQYFEWVGAEAPHQPRPSNGTTVTCDITG